MLNVCYSRMDSRSETADQSMTRANDDMLGSCATSSSMLMAFAALTATLSFGSWRALMESFTIFLMFLGVMLESAICCKLALALVNLSIFSCCFLSLLVVVFTPVRVRDSSCFLGLHIWFSVHPLG